MSAPSNGASARKLKILMLHGFTQSGPLFHAKTRALEKALQKAFPASSLSPLDSYPGGISLTYPTGPVRLLSSDIPGYSHDGNQDDEEETDAWAWWKGNLREGSLVNLEKGFSTIAQTIREEGPFDGVIGFSQGGAAAAMVASLLEEGRKEAFGTQERKGGMGFPPSFAATDGGPINPPMKFAVIYAGFWAANELYRGFYEPKIKTQMLHVIGSLDSVVEEDRSAGLIDVCEEEQVVYHPGGHFVPIGKDMAGALVSFIKQTCADEAPKEESAEDMDVPF